MGSWPEWKSPARRPLYGSSATQQQGSLIRCSPARFGGQARANLPPAPWRLMSPAACSPSPSPAVTASAASSRPSTPSSTSLPISRSRRLTSSPISRGAPVPAFLLRHHQRVLVGTAVTGEVAAGGRLLPRHHQSVPNRPAAHRLASAAPTVNTGLAQQPAAANPVNFVCIPSLFFW